MRRATTQGARTLVENSCTRVRTDEEGHERGEEADGDGAAVHGGKRADGALLEEPPERDLGLDERDADRHEQEAVGDEEGAAAVLEREEGEAPDVADADHRAGAGENEGEARAPAVAGAPLRRCGGRHGAA